MMSSLRICLLFLLGPCLTLLAQEKKQVMPVRVRAVLHDPVRPVANLYYSDKAGAVAPLMFRPQDLSEEMVMLPVNGSLVLYDKATIDPEKPQESIAASVKISETLKQAICLVMPSPNGTKPAYRMILIDDSEQAFPRGESRILSFIAAETVIQAGEHRISVSPGKIGKLPPVKRVNDFNMAQTNFYYQRGNSWEVFTERQLQYVDACRRLFIVHVTPGALQPTVTTIVDTSPQ
jgi:hypothetical protein